MGAEKIIRHLTIGTTAITDQGRSTKKRTLSLSCEASAKLSGVPNFALDIFLLRNGLLEGRKIEKALTRFIELLAIERNWKRFKPSGIGKNSDCWRLFAIAVMNESMYGNKRVHGKDGLDSNGQSVSTKKLLTDRKLASILYISKTSVNEKWHPRFNEVTKQLDIIAQSVSENS